MWILRTFRGSNLLLLEEKFPSESQRENSDLIYAIFFQTSEKNLPFLGRFFHAPKQMMGLHFLPLFLHCLPNSRGEKAVTVSGYWQKPLTVTALAVIKFH
jgi:hypothetical protein